MRGLFDESIKGKKEDLVGITRREFLKKGLTIGTAFLVGSLYGCNEDKGYCVKRGSLADPVSIYEGSFEKPDGGKAWARIVLSPRQTSILYKDEEYQCLRNYNPDVFIDIRRYSDEEIELLFERPDMFVRMKGMNAYTEEELREINNRIGYASFELLREERKPRKIKANKEMQKILKSMGMDVKEGSEIEIQQY